MAQAKPYCKECVFAIVENDKQTGCRTGRLKQFIKRGEASQSRDFYELSQFCNMMRPQEWSDKVAKLDLDELEVVEDQIIPIIGICVKDNGSDKDLKDTIDSILEIDYQSPKLKIVISSDRTNAVPKLANLVNLLQTKWRNSEVIFHLLDIQRTKETEVFQKIAGAPYFIYMDAGQKIKSDFLQAINRSLNQHLDKVVVFDQDEVYAIRGSVMRSCYLEFESYKEALEFIIHESKKQGAYKKV